jgi:ribonuclease E
VPDHDGNDTTSAPTESSDNTVAPAKAVTRRRRSASRPAGPPTPVEPSAPSAAPAAAASEPPPAAAVDETPATRAPAKRTRKKATAPAEAFIGDNAAAADSPPTDTAAASAGDESVAPARRRRTRATAVPFADEIANATDTPVTASGEASVPVVLFQPPTTEAAPPRRRGTTAAQRAAFDAAAGTSGDAETDAETDAEPTDGGASDESGDGDETTGASRSSRRRRGRRGRGGRGGSGAGNADGSDSDSDSDDTSESTRPPTSEADAPQGTDSAGADDADGDQTEDDGTGTGTRRRRRRRRTTGGGEGGTPGPDDPPNTVVHVREPRKAAAVDDGVRGVKGSTRIEAKRQRRRDGRDTQRRRPSIITEAEFLARRESVDRVMVVRQGEERTQIAVLEDGVLVEHYVTSKDSASMVGNVYLGKVQNVLPSMEAAFVDIGRGRNAVLYAGEVNYDASALEGRPPRIEQALKSGQTVLVQVTKDPIGHKGGRLTSQVSLPGRYMVYVPDGRLSGISRKLPDTERSRLKGILKRLTPEDAGVIIRTAAEGASEEALERDLNRLKAQWEVIDAKAKAGANAPSLIYGEPDLVIRVVRDIFNEDFASLVVQGADEWDTIDNYVRWVAPDLADRTKRWEDSEDVFEAYRVDEQLAKALDRKVWLPSGGYLVIDRTEAMIVVDVNTGKFTGKGGNLEETVTKNNIEAAEEIVRQLRLRDLGGIIVIDFIDMVLESNRDLVLRRLLECLGRDRTRHQVAEVTSLGLVQMTRKRVGEGLLESFSETCKECGGSGVILTIDPVVAKRPPKPPRMPKPTAVETAAKAARAEAAQNGAAAIIAAPESEVVAEVAAKTESDVVPETKPKATRKRRTPAKAAAEGAVDAEAPEAPVSDGSDSSSEPAAADDEVGASV